MTESNEYWNNRYKAGLTSGYGSYGEALERKLKWLSGLDINSIYDYGCGDFNFGKHLLEIYPFATYIGYDSSEEIIKKNRLENPTVAFHSEKPEIKGDLILCVDVLFHILDDNQYKQILNDLRSHWTKYLALSAYEREGDESETGGHVAVRKFEPSYFGIPIVREISEENGQLYFYLFKK